jgi:hypothetical protein
MVMDCQAGSVDDRAEANRTARLSAKRSFKIGTMPLGGSVYEREFYGWSLAGWCLAWLLAC